MDPTRRRILEQLVERPSDGPELADALSISRAAVWKHVEALRDEGVDVRSTDAGYDIRSLPEYGEAAIVAGLPGDYEVCYADSMPSTNERARELAREGAGETAVLTDEQPAGRGRLGRTWAGPSGGIYLSLLLRPDQSPADVGFLTAAAGVAVAEALESLGVDPAIKWPNDILVDDRKVAGILTEMEGEADRVNWAIVGIGINANVRGSELPDGATSLTAILGEPVPRREVVHAVIEAFERFRDDPEETISALRKRSATLGQRVRVETPTGTVVGTAADILHPGTLVVRTADSTEYVTAGDCEHLRAEDGTYPSSAE